jgi:two-component system response regulator FixJ
MLTQPATEKIKKHWTHMLSATPGAPVYVIDDESDVRRSLHFLLSTIGLVSWPFASAQDFLDNFEALEPAPVLLDIRMPNVDGLQLMAVLRERGVNWPIIIISAHGDIQVAVKAIKMGAIDFLEKPFEFEALDSCLQSAFAQMADRNQSFSARNAARGTFALLSPRESEVINVLMRGIPNKTAAHMLDLSVRTVEMHRANALAKLRVKSIAEVIRLATAAELEAGINIRNDAQYAQ